MTLKNWALAAVCLALAAGVPGPAAAQKGGAAGGNEITIRVCNNSNNNARVALSYEPVGAGQFYNEGWYGVPARSCQDLVRTDNGYFYGYAEVENNGTTYWAGNHSLCVQYPGPYGFWTEPAAVSCSSNQETRNFVVMQTDQWGVYTWTLDP